MWTIVNKKTHKQNMELRKQIVDLADIWDGDQSWHYGKTLTDILNKIGINDVPDFYKKENMDKLMDELEKKRNAQV